MRLALRLSSVCIVACGSTFAQTSPVTVKSAGQSAPSIDQSLEMVTVSSPAVSPDATRVVYQQTRTNWDADAFENDLWMVSTQNPHPHRFTAPNKSATAPAWSPDGRWIAFLSTQPGVIPKSPADKPQIYVAPAEGGEGVQLTHFETGVNHFEWSPDSKSIAFTAADPDSQTRKDRKESLANTRSSMATTRWCTSGYLMFLRTQARHSLRRCGLPTDPSASMTSRSLRTASKSPFPRSGILILSLLTPLTFTP